MVKISLCRHRCFGKLTGVAVYGDEEFPVGIDGKVAFNDKAVKSDKLY